MSRGQRAQHHQPHIPGELSAQHPAMLQLSTPGAGAGLVGLGGLELREGPFLLGEEGFWGGGRFLRAGEH